MENRRSQEKQVKEETHEARPGGTQAEQGGPNSPTYVGGTWRGIRWGEHGLDTEQKPRSDQGPCARLPKQRRGVGCLKPSGMKGTLPKSEGKFDAGCFTFVPVIT